MKKSIYYFLFFITSSLWSQSINPTLISIPKVKFQGPNLMGSNIEWFLPFREKTNSLANAYDTSSNFGTLSGVSIRPAIDSSKTNSIYVELVSYIPSNICKLSLGTNLVQSDLNDTNKKIQDIAFQKLTNGGGNIVLNINRPLLFWDGILFQSSFFITSFDLTLYSDVLALNEDVYNPGWGLQFNPNFDLRICNIKITDRQEGNFFRLGLSGRWQYNLFNKKWEDKIGVDNKFNNLSIISIGGYLGLAMFNIQVTYNLFNKNDAFFDGKRWLLRVEIVQVKF